MLMASQLNGFLKYPWKYLCLHIHSERWLKISRFLWFAIYVFWFQNYLVNVPSTIANMDKFFLKYFNLKIFHDLKVKSRLDIYCNYLTGRFDKKEKRRSLCKSYCTLVSNLLKMLTC